MRAKRTWLGLALAILAALAVGGLVASHGGADEQQLEEVKEGEVSNQGAQADDIDYDDEEPVPPESVTMVGDNITIVSNMMTPPGTMTFKEFPSPNPWHFVDIETDPDAPPGSADTDTASAIKISVEDVPETAGAWPLKGEGNLQPPPGGQGTAEFHWSAKIAKVKLYWETYDQPGDNEAIDDHPAEPANGGKRIFPGKKEYNDSVEDAAKRRLAFAVVEFTEGGAPASGTEIYFRLWDVDDPSSDEAPIDDAGSPNPGTNGPDNRDASACFAAEDANHISHVEIGKVKRFEETTTCEGYKAKMTIRVGMQPGDNWRFAVAWGDGAQARLQAMTQAQADTCQPPDGVAISEMLTTWRKLHIEVDSMQADNDKTNLLNGESTIDSAVHDDGTDRTNLEVADVPGMWDDWDVDDAFNGGWIKVQNEESPWEVVDFEASVSDDNVFVSGDHESANGKTYFLGDDDYASVSENPVLIINHPRDPNTGWLETRLAKAYICPEYYRDTEDGNLTFDRNLHVSSLPSPWGEFLPYLMTDSDFEGYNCPSFWVSRLVSAHQPGDEVDNDPVNESTTGGAAAGIHAAVFLETTRDFFVEASQVEGADERAVVVHEIGHTLGADDITTGRETAGVMYDTLPVAETWFNDNSLYEIREKTHE